MNTKQVLIAVAAAIALSAAAAMAQSTTPAAAPATTPPAATASADQGSGHKGRHEMKFEDRKAHALARLEKSAAKIQQKQACVQASTDKDSLQACFPKRGQGKGNGNGGWHKHGGKSGATPTPATAPAPAEQ